MREQMTDRRPSLQPPLPPPLALRIFLLLAGKQNRMVQRVWQATVSTTHLHRNNDQLRHPAELRAETRVRPRVSQREPDSAVSRDHLKQNWKQ